jgi:hypothetical protein
MFAKLLKRRAGSTLLTLATCTSMAWTLPASAASFEGWQLIGGWPVAQMGARIDWSSDFGQDWMIGISSSGEWGEIGGPHSHSSSRPYEAVDADVSVNWSVSPRGGALGDTFSGGEVVVGPKTDLAGGAVASQRFHLYSQVGANADWHGVGTSANLVGYASLYSIAQPYTPIHWRLDWNSATSGNAITSSYLYFTGVFSQQIGGTAGHATGVFEAGSYPWGSNGLYMFPDLILQSSAGDNAGDPRAGRIDTVVTLSFSSQPILAAPVPEPHTWALMLAGVLVTARLAQRRGRVRQV